MIEELPDLHHAAGVLFDLDGVLTPTAEVHMRAWQKVFDEVFARCPRARVELYGKEVRPGRKLGHVTVYGEDLESARDEARAAVSLLYGEPRPDRRS